ncbi:unnamed protein product [Polarella glacialis]|uniref:EF-hand domain-containing protein n=1 Tax=Polarella glacialis TaxID=89957 RepID=A0A813JTZ6_POLGL|nr:unnamed protein product [Polarella glacialis]CAE8686933.1 unnamed protein product [Polarella glacialis]
MAPSPLGLLAVFFLASVAAGEESCLLQQSNTKPASISPPQVPLAKKVSAAKLGDHYLNMLSKIDFETLDMDGDKIISLADAEACLDSGSLGVDLKESLTSDLVEAFFAKADSDSSGGLDEDELASAFQQYKTEQLVSHLQARASAPAMIASSRDSCIAGKGHCVQGAGHKKCCSGLACCHFVTHSACYNPDRMKKCRR